MPRMDKDIGLIWINPETFDPHMWNGIAWEVVPKDRSEFIELPEDNFIRKYYPRARYLVERSYDWEAYFTTTFRGFRHSLNSRMVVFELLEDAILWRMRG